MEKKSLIDRGILKRIIGGMQESNPNLAKELMSLYSSLDQVCQQLSVSFNNNEVNHQLRILGIEPVARQMNKRNILGANIHIGITNEYIDGYINGGQTLMLLERGGGMDYDTHIYKSLDSVIMGDNDLAKLAQMLRITEHKIKNGIKAILSQSRKRAQQQQRQKNSQPSGSRPNGQPQRTVKRNIQQQARQQAKNRQAPMNQSRTQNPSAQRNSPKGVPDIPIPGTEQKQKKKTNIPNNGEKQSPKQSSQKKKNTHQQNGQKSNGGMDGLLNDNVPPFPLKTDKQKISLPDDLKITGKKKKKK